MHQHRHLQTRPANGVGHRALVAKVGQRDQDAVDLVGLFPEQIRAQPGVAEAFDGAARGGFDGWNDGANAELLERGQNLLATRVAQVSGKESAVPDNDPKGNHNWI